MNIYLDTSVIVKWYKQNEQNEKEAMILLDDVTNLRIFAYTSSLTSLELTRALQKAGYSDRNILEILQNFDALTHSVITRCPITDECTNLARELILKTNIIASDTIHMATAVLDNCQQIITADERHMLKKKVVDHYQEQFDISITHIRDYQNFK